MLANMLRDKAQYNGGLHFWLVGILPWRCAVVVALRPCMAMLAGSRIWGDLPLSVRLYVHSYTRRDVWRREVAASGEPLGDSPDVATN